MTNPDVAVESAPAVETANVVPTKTGCTTVQKPTQSKSVVKLSDITYFYPYLM
jgi:hypothetical protein